MGGMPGRQAATAQTIAAGATLTLTFPDLGQWDKLMCLAKAVLEAGAALRFSAKVRPADDADWYDVRVVDLSGASLATLVANVALAASATKAILMLTVLAEDVQIVIEETGGVAGATLDVWVLTD